MAMSRRHSCPLTSHYIIFSRLFHHLCRRFPHASCRASMALAFSRDICALTECIIFLEKFRVCPQVFSFVAIPFAMWFLEKSLADPVSPPVGGSRRRAMVVAAFLPDGDYYTKNREFLILKFALNLSQFAISSSPIPIRAQAAVLSRISSIRQLATDELRLASRGNSDLVGAARRDASPHRVDCLAISTPADVNRRSFIAAPPSVQASCLRPSEGVLLVVAF